jgi:WD40 repeat protein
MVKSLPLLWLLAVSLLGAGCMRDPDAAAGPAPGPSPSEQAPSPLATAHQGPVTRIAFAPDGQALASSGRDGLIRLWDVATGAERRHILAHPRGVNALAFARDGHTLASAGQSDPAIALWEAATGRKVGEIRDGRAAQVLAFSPDGTLLASAGFDAKVHLWEVATRKRLHDWGPGGQLGGVPALPRWRSPPTARPWRRRARTAP